jgi:diguanylate cyclase (GGDEF)-like protein/PAS domain S-box-containing protein
VKKNKNGFSRSIFIKLIGAIALALLSVMAPVIYFMFQTDKEKLIANAKYDIDITLHSVEKIISEFIQSYAINEYEMLIRTETMKQNIAAIVVHDYNMGKIRGDEVYISGMIQNSAQTLRLFDPKNPQDLQKLEQSFYEVSSKIYSDLGELIGTVYIYGNDEFIAKALNDALVQNVIMGVLLFVSLCIVLYVLISAFVLQPITQIIMHLKDSDADGIPKKKLSLTGTRETNNLVSSINTMIDVVKRSRDEIAVEKERFQLAVEGTKDGLWDWDVRENSVYFSPQWKAMLGFNEDEITNSIDEWKSRVHPEDLKDTLKELDAHLQGKTDTYESKHRIKRKDGNWMWILDRGKAKFDANKKAVRVVGFHTDITDEVEHEQMLKHTATHDTLTGLPNRFLFNEVIQNQLFRTKRYKKLFALLFLDLDGFKKINDDYGHETGDKVLICVAKRMKETVRANDVLARLGGDEFVMGLSDLEDRSQLNPLLDRLLGKIEEPMRFEGIEKDLFVSVSIGVALYSIQKDQDPETLLRQADYAMYQAKTSGKRQYRFFSD